MPRCGSKVETVDVAEDSLAVQAFDMVEVVGQKMYYHTKEKGTDCWFSNLTTMKEKVGRLLDVGEEEECFAITPKMMKEEIKAFLEMHSEHIDKLKQAYDKVEIVWGVLAYWR